MVRSNGEEISKKGNFSEEPPDFDERKLRIALLTFFYKPAGGGVPRYVENLSKKLSEDGHKVDIITASYNGKKVERKGNLTVYYLPCMNVFAEDSDNKSKSRDFLKFLRAYSKRKPDIFVAQNFHTCIRAVGHSFALNTVSIEKNIPSTLTVHAFIKEDEYALLKTHLMKDLYWERIISVGSNLAESLFKKGVSCDDIKIIYPPVDTEKFKPGLGAKWLRSRIEVSEKDYLILHASRIETENTADEKGIFTLIKALSSVKDKNVKLLIAASPTTPVFEESREKTIKKIKETAKLLGLEERVVVETFGSEDMSLVYNGVDLCVLGSKYENCSLVLAEAMACGLPVVGTSIGGIPEIVEDGKSGKLVNPDNPVELAKVIKQLIRNKKKAKKMGEFGREIVIGRQDLNKIAKKIAGIYESAIKNNEKSPKS